MMGAGWRAARVSVAHERTNGDRRDGIARRLAWIIGGAWVLLIWAGTRGEDVFSMRE